MGRGYQNCVGEEAEHNQKLTRSASFKGKKKPIIRATGSEVDDFVALLNGSDPVRVELTRMENEVRDKDRELGDAYVEIKALKFSERLKEKAVEELTDELKKVDGKLKLTESQLESKNLEIKRINEEKKAAQATQFAAEATVRRVHAAQKDEEVPPIEAIIAPLEAELKLARMEVSKLQEDNKALERLTKSKEAALLEAECTIKTALAKASLVDDLLNKNHELDRRIEICQEENKILDKLQRQKVSEVEKLTQTIRDLEESVLAGGAAANMVRDYQRKLQEINEEKRILDRELARAKVSANRVALVVANDWKDDNDKVMPVKQWLEERKCYQGELQLLKDKLATAERASKSEAQLKEKYLLRFKALEETLKVCPIGLTRSSSQGRNASNGDKRRLTLGGSENMPKRSSNGFLSRKLNFTGSSPTITEKRLSILNNTNKVFPVIDENENSAKLHPYNNEEEGLLTEKEDSVSGMLYDILQKETIKLRKACQEKDQVLKNKDEAIEILAKKVETLNKAMEVEAKKMRRELATMEKEVQRLSTTRAAIDSHSIRTGK